MLQLPLIEYQARLQLKTEGSQRLLFDPLRRKWVVLQPEEMVRQLLLLYLMEAKGFNKNRLAVERGLNINGLQKRCDILAYDGQMQPFLLVECKAPQVPVTQAVFRQIAIYNLPLKVPYLLVSNGPISYCCKMDYEAEDFIFLSELPFYPGANLPA